MLQWLQNVFLSNFWETKYFFGKFCVEKVALEYHEVGVTTKAVKTWLNGWVTSYRMHEEVLHNCLLGCIDAPDSLQHYLQCSAACGWIDPQYGGACDMMKHTINARCDLNKHRGTSKKTKILANQKNRRNYPITNEEHRRKSPNNQTIIKHQGKFAQI